MAKNPKGDNEWQIIIVVVVVCMNIFEIKSLKCTEFLLLFKRILALQYIRRTKTKKYVCMYKQMEFIIHNNKRIESIVERFQFMLYKFDYFRNKTPIRMSMCVSDN